MQNLTRASQELFRRTPDETFPSLDVLVNHCHQQQEASLDHWISPTGLWTKPADAGSLLLAGGEDQTFHMNDWSFGQLCRLTAKRDQRRDAFARVIQRAMETQLGDDADETRAELAKVGVSRTLARQALELAQEHGRFTVFNVVDALTRLSRQLVNAGDRTEVDQQAGRLLSLAV